MVVLVWLISCSNSVEKDSFALEYASSYCRALKKCSRGRFDAEYDLIADCEADVSESMEDFILSLEDCVYDETKAQECLQNLSEATCAEHWEDSEQLDVDCYENIWVCNA